MPAGIGYDPIALMLAALGQGQGAGGIGGGGVPGAGVPGANPMAQLMAQAGVGGALAPGRAERVSDQLLNPQIPVPGQMPLPPAAPQPPLTPTVGQVQDQMAQRHLGRVSERSGLVTPGERGLPSLNIPSPFGPSSPAAMPASPTPVQTPPNVNTTPPSPVTGGVNPQQLGSEALRAATNPDQVAAERAAAGEEPPAPPAESGIAQALSALEAVQPMQDQRTPPPGAVSPGGLGGQLSPAFLQMLLSMQPQGRVPTSLGDLLSRV